MSVKYGNNSFELIVKNKVQTKTFVAFMDTILRFKICFMQTKIGERKNVNAKYSNFVQIIYETK